MMMQRVFLISSLLVCVTGIGCSDSSQNDDAGLDGGDTSSEDGTEDQDGGTDEDTASDDSDTLDTNPVTDTESFGDLPCADNEAGYNEETPGFHIFWNVMSVQMMGQNITMALGGVQITAREDFPSGEDPGGEEPTLDSCWVPVAEPTPPPECLADEECAPEQQCLPETDDNGAPIEGTGNCVTPRELLDVGPMTVFGIGTEPTVFAFNSAQSGIYSLGGTGDGTIDPALMPSDVDVTFFGEGNPSAGVGPFRGEMHVPAALVVTKPETVNLPMGIPGIQILNNADLELEWEGTADLPMVITLQSANASINCYVEDDGSFTIPAAMIKAAKLGNIAFLNMLILDRSSSAGQVCGADITYGGLFNTAQVTVNAQKIANPDTDTGSDADTENTTDSESGT